MKETAPCCGDCIYWIETETGGPVTIGAPKRGLCFGAPPQVIPVIQNQAVVGGMNIRPIIAETDSICSLFEDDGEDAGPEDNGTH